MRIAVLLLLTLSAAAKPRVDACEDGSECMLIPRTCCGTCGAATAKDVRAVNTDWFETGARSECAGQSCPDCHDSNAHQLVAVCEKKTCKVLKLDELPLTRCKRDDECATRPVGCCGGEAIAVRKDQLERLSERMCGKNGVGCGRMMQPALPAAICLKGRCAVP
jgi:hypothetical protein